MINQVGCISGQNARGALSRDLDVGTYIRKKSVVQEKLLLAGFVSEMQYWIGDRHSEPAEHNIFEQPVFKVCTGGYLTI